MQKKLREIKNSVERKNVFEKNNLKINNNLNQINIIAIKSGFNKLNNNQTKGNLLNNERLMSPRTFSRLEPEGINNNRFKVESKAKNKIHRNKSENNVISFRNEINVLGNKLYKYKENNKLDKIINNDQFSLINIPKRKIKIVTKKVLKKTSYIYSKFKDDKTKISSQNEFDIKRTIKDNQINKNRIFNELNNKMSNENIINIRGRRRVFDNIKINKNNIEMISLLGNKIYPQKKRLTQTKSCENVINRKTQFKITGKKKLLNENIINRKTQFKIEGIKKDLIEKNCDTCDLIPKEIKITTKKIVKKTNIIRPKINNVISYKNEICLEGLKEPENQIIQEDYNKKKQEWKELLKEDVQQNKFMIKRISKNIYSKLKDLKEKEDKFIRNNKENIVDNNIQINIQGLEEDENKEFISGKKFNPLLLKKENVNKNNIIVRKINIEIISNKYTPQENADNKFVISKNWNESLKEESLQSKFTIKKKKTKKYKNEIEKNIEIFINKTEDTISKTKEKIIDNWKEINSEEKIEDLNIEKQPKKREIKITTKKIIKKTNYIYKKFDNNNLIINHNEINLKGRKKMKSSEYTNENSKISISIGQTYVLNTKLYDKELKVSKVNEIYINADDYKKKEIKITTKISLTKTKFLYKRFKNNYISHENQIILKRQKKHDKVKNKLKDFSEYAPQKEEKTTDTFDLKDREIKITTKKIVKKTNILRPKFTKNIICENAQVIINKTKKENKIEYINIDKRNNENIINRVSVIELFPNEMKNNNYNITNEDSDEKDQLSEVNSKDKKLKTVVVYLDKKFDLKNCFDKWNYVNIKSKNKITEDLTDFETINLEDKISSNMNTKSSNNEDKKGKKKRIKIKYVKNKINDNNNSSDSSKSGENKISLSEEMDLSNDMNENKSNRYQNINEIDEENKEMKSLEPKSTKKPFILRINKVEVKKKILKSNSKIVKIEEKEDKMNKSMNLYIPMIATFFFQKWKQNEKIDIDYIQKIKRKFIVKSLVMNRKLNKFKISLIKYVFKNK